MSFPRIVPFFLSIILVVLVGFSAQSRRNTSKYFKCSNRESGSWNFGTVSSCNVSPYMDPKKVRELYSAVIFDTRKDNESAERRRYMQKMYPVMRELSRKYLLERNPQASQDEVNAWMQSVFALLHQESFWTHYKKKNEYLNMVRGDFGHGHGIMQVDDRFHFDKIESGYGADLVKNVIYGLEIFYDSWRNASKQKCIRSSSGWLKQAYAAYAAYNGGPGAFCRWINPNHRWSRNDRGFREKMSAQMWRQYVDDFNASSFLNFTCGLKNIFQCPLKAPSSRRTASSPPPLPPPPTSPVERALYETEKKQVCYYKDQKLHCVESKKDLVCLGVYMNFKSIKTHPVPESWIQKYNIKKYDRNQICKKSFSDLLPIETPLLTLKDVNLFDENWIVQGMLPKDEKISVKGFSISDNSDSHQTSHSVVYKILWKSSLFYVHFQNLQHGRESFYPIKDQEIISNVAQEGQQIEIQNPKGIKQRNTNTGDVIQLIPRGSRLKVLRRQIVGEAGRVFYWVYYKGHTGRIYGGEIDLATPGQWIRVLKNDSHNVLVSLKSNIPYIMPKVCSRDSCKDTQFPFWGLKNSKIQTKVLASTSQEIFALVLEEKKDWVLIYSQRNQAHGWIPKGVINEF